MNDVYYLMPFRMERILDHEILVNELGDFLVVPIGTAQCIVERKLEIQSELYKDLYSNFFISSQALPALIDNWATRYRTKKTFLDSFTALHIFVLTLRCNQNCIYCQASSKESDQSHYDMSYSDLEEAIDLMFCSPSQTLTMEFQGGEPTLVFRKIKFAVERTVSINVEKKRNIDRKSVV